MTNTHQQRQQTLHVKTKSGPCKEALVVPSRDVEPALRCQIVLPLELVGLVMTFLDRESLLRCACVSIAWESMVQQREIWKRLCFQEWPPMRRQVLSQLPGAPDYDVSC